MSDDIKDQVLISVYGQNAPDAAKFGVGATTLAQIKQATDARRALANEQATTRGPVRKDAP
jgi:hypothetical protein